MFDVSGLTYTVSDIHTLIGIYTCDHCDVTWRVTDKAGDNHCWMCGRFGRRKKK